MDRLAIAISGMAIPQGNSLAVPVAPRVADQLYRARGEAVLAYTLVGDHQPAFVGLADVSGLLFSGSRDATKVVLTFSRRFAVPRLEPTLRRLSRGKSALRLSAETFAAILARDDEAVIPSVGERPLAFAYNASGLDGIVQVYRGVLDDFENSCPFTDQVYARSAGLNPMLHVEPIRPLHHNGTMEPANLIVMAADVLKAWRDGQLTLAPDLSFVFKAGLDPEVVRSLRPEGRMRLPRSGTVPDPESLAFHRSQVCGL